MPAKKLVLLILAVLLAFTTLDMVNWFASPEAISTVQTGNIRTLKGESFADTTGLEPFQSIIYYLDAPLAEETIAVLTYYYADYSSGKNEQHPLKGARQVAFQIPLDSYAALDCYINANVKIEKITISDQPSSQIHDHYPLRPLKILVPSAILLAVIFLFIYIKPLNTFIKSIDQKIIDPKTRLKGVTIAYIVFAVAALLHHIYVTLYYKYVLTGATDLGIPLLIFSAITFLFGKLWKDKVSWILLALLCLKYARTALLGQQILNDTSYIYILSAYSFFGCYGVSRALDRKYWKRFFSSFCLLWTIAISVLALIGIYMALTGVPIKNFGSEWFTIFNFRAYFIYQPVIAGIVFSLSIFVAFIGFNLTKKKSLRLFYILSSLICFFAGSLTGTRTAYMISALLVAFCIYIVLRDRLKPGQPKNLPLTAGKFLLLFLCFSAVAIIIVVIHQRSVNLLNLVRTRGDLLISTAYAENTESLPPIAQRNLQLHFSVDDFFSGRLTLWRIALQVISASPKDLLLGQSVYNPMTHVNEIRLSQGLNYLYHSHNTYIQILLENGIPGLLCYFSFIIIFLFHAVQIIRNRNLPFWQRLLPIGTILCLLEGLVEITCHVTYGYPQMTILYLFAGFTIALNRQAKKVGLAD